MTHKEEAQLQTVPVHLSRAAVLNGITALFPEPRYLEIGVSRGDTFFAVQAAQKVAVDPQFAFDVPVAKEKYQNAVFHEVDSDVYFGQIAEQDQKFDVIFIDGMHTFEAALRDFSNSIEFLSQDGVIVIDDVIPNAYYASLPDHRTAVRVRNHRFPDTANRSWMGNVYRTRVLCAQLLSAVSVRHGGKITVSLWFGKRGVSRQSWGCVRWKRSLGYRLRVL